MIHALEEQVGAVAPLWIFAAETAAMIAVVAYACLARRGPKHHGQSPLLKFARRRRLAVAAVTGGVLLVRVALLPVMPPPEPVVMDEFSYLLQADTFASGRIANPVHPFWKHFETFYILQRPAYASMYPPGSGLFMAVGQVISGHPWTGVLAANALMCGAVTWMLQGWMPPGWALLGGILAGLRIGVFSYWMNSYWGGAVPAIAGSLVLGAIGRLFRSPRTAHGLTLGIGLVLLANTRPYEGMLVGLTVAAALAWKWFSGRPGKGFRGAALRPVAAAGICLLAGGAAMGYYSWRITGSPLEFPYSAWERQYRPTSNFIIFAARPAPAYNHKIFYDHYALDQVPFHEYLRSPLPFLRRNIGRIRNVWLFYYGPILTIPLLMLPWILRDRRMRLAAVVVAAVLAGSMIVFAPFPHYFAPVTGALIAIAVQGLRHLRAGLRFGRAHGWAAARAVPAALAMVTIAGGTAQALGVPFQSERNPRPDRRMTWIGTPPGGLERAEILSRLTRAGGRHLVFVRYADRHDPMFDWVYNPADPDRAAVVFAREMSFEADRALMSYYSGRRIWVVEPDAEPVRLREVEGAGLEPAETVVVRN